MFKKIWVMLFLVITIIVGSTLPVYAQDSAPTGEATQPQEPVIDRGTDGTSGGATPTEDTTSADEKNSLSEDGNATLGDKTNSSEDKEFLTVKTKNGETFYMIIDHQRDTDNVYFLNMVDESDLEAFAKENGGLSGGISLPSTTTKEPELNADSNDNNKSDIESGQKIKEAKKQSTKDSKKVKAKPNYMLIAILAVAAFGIIYYFKIYKKKKQEGENEYETEEELEDEPEVQNAEVYDDDDFDERKESEISDDKDNLDNEEDNFSESEEEDDEWLD